MDDHRLRCNERLSTFVTCPAAEVYLLGEDGPTLVDVVGTDEEGAFSINLPTID